MLKDERVYCQAFADDVVLVFDGETALEVEREANAVLARVLAWGVDRKLRFAAHKTCAMLVTRKLKFDVPRLCMGGVDIGLSKEIRVLGLVIDSGLTFTTHVREVCKKATIYYKKLARAARVGWGLSPDVIRVIYKAVIEPTILYAAAAWAPACRFRMNLKNLNMVQRAFTQKLVKAHRTVSLNSALVLAGLLPLDLRATEVRSLYEARGGMPCPGLRGREIEMQSRVTELPHPADQISLEFGLVDDAVADADVRTRYDVRIFTDGSGIDGLVGAAVSIWNADAETKAVKLALAPYCTVYQAELLALGRAVEEAEKLKGKGKVAILSDSRSALQSVALGSLHRIAAKTRSILHKCKAQNRVIDLFWIKAHADMEGNERADCLAKEAAHASRKKRLDYDLCPVSFVKRMIRTEAIDEWEMRYQKGETAGVTKFFFPSATAAYRIVGKLDISLHMTRLLTGHGGLAEYLHRFKLSDSPLCPCQQGDQTVPHLLLECPMFARERFEVEQALGTRLEVQTVPILMTGKEHRDVFLQYGIKIIKSVETKNKTKVV